MIGMKMKRFCTLFCTLAAVCGLTTAAYADVIAPGPGELLLHGVMGWPPLALVIAVVIVTVVLLRKFWKRK